MVYGEVYKNEVNADLVSVSDASGNVFDEWCTRLLVAASYLCPCPPTAISHTYTPHQLHDIFVQ